jgi:dTDP-L-rhamnose 4-epimerase
MNILITGGAGFIGTHTAHALNSLGHKVRILDCLDPQIHGLNAAFPDSLIQVADCVKGDVCNAVDCESALDGIEMVFHFASRTGVGQSMYDIGDYIATNVLGTGVLLEAILKARVPLKRFVLSSSRAVYGEGLFCCAVHGVTHPNQRSAQAMQSGDFMVHCPQCGLEMNAIPTTTDCPPEPLSVYAITKKQQEDYCNYAAMTFGLPLVTLRYFNVYGSGQSLKNPYTGVVSIFYSLLREGRSLSLYEGGFPVRDFVHVSDVVQANLLAMASKPTGGVFNVGTGVPATIGDIARAQASAMGMKAMLEDRGEYRVGDIFGCYADISLSQEILGYQPHVDMARGMEEFVAWAAGQESENRYDKTVAELRSHGLFGKAES